MTVQVKEREYWTPEMLDYIERCNKVAEETFLPYRRVFNATPWLQLRVNMPDVINRMFSEILENKLMGGVVPKEYGDMGLTLFRTD